MWQIKRDIFILLLIGLMVSGCGTDSVGTFDKAKTLAQQDQLDAAIIEMKSAIQGDPNNAEMRLYLGILYNTNYQYGPAIKELEKAMRFGLSESTKAHTEMARALFYDRNYKKLIDDVNLDLDYSDDERASVLAFLGLANLKSDEREIAEEHLIAGREIAPENSELGLLDANIKIVLGKSGEALEAVDKVLEREPEHLDALLLRGAILQLLNRSEEAIEGYVNILGLDAENAQALVFIVPLLVAEGRVDEAENHVKTLMRKYPTIPQSRVQKGLVLLSRGDANNALNEARAAVSMDPNYSHGHLLAGMAAKSMGALAQANESFKEVLSRQPFNMAALSASGQIYLELNQPLAALRLVEPVLNLGFDHVDLSTIAGIAHQSMGNNEQAVEYLDQALAKDPNSKVSELSRAFVEIDSGNFEAGQKAFATVLSGANRASASDSFLIIELLKRNQIDKAERYAEDLLGRFPDQAIPNNLAGVVEMSKNNTEAAEKYFEHALELDPVFVPAATNLMQIDVLRGDRESARGRLSKILDIAPRDTKALVAAGELEYTLDELDKAIDFFEEAVAAEPAALGPVLRLIDFLVQSKNPGRAASVGMAALEEHPENGTLIAATAESKLLSGEKSQANEIAKRILNLPTLKPEAYVKLAAFQFRARLPGEAKFTLERGLNTFPDSAALHVAMVKYFLELRETREAEIYAQDIQKASPDAPFGHLLLGEMYEELERLDEAKKQFEIALQKQESGHIAAKLFGVSAKRDLSSALMVFEKWVAQNPDDALGRAKLADYFVSVGQYAKATPHYEYLLEKETYSIENLNSLAWSYSNLDDPRALAIAEAAYKGNGNAPHIADTLGWVLMNLDRFQEARPYLEKAVRLEPLNPEYRFHLGVNLISMGEEALGKLNLQAAMNTKGIKPALKQEIEEHLRQ